MLSGIIDINYIGYDCGGFFGCIFLYVYFYGFVEFYIIRDYNLIRFYFCFMNEVICLRLYNYEVVVLGIKFLFR